MSRAMHRLFLASAGTGKTFQLTNHFLRMLFEGVEPQRILATTFTRKAAGEILDRVLERLVKGARGGKALDELRTFCERPDLTEETCVALLGRLTRAIDRFQVRTIDAFFVQLTRLFALDLALAPDWSIVDEREDAELREESVQDVLASGSTTDRLELLRGLRAGAAPSRVHQEVLSQLELGRDLFLESDVAAWSRLTAAGALDEGALAASLANLRETEVPLTKAGKSDGRYQKAVNAVCEAVAKEDWSAVFEAGLGARLLDCSCVYYNVPFPDRLIEDLTPIVGHAVAQEVLALAERNAALHELLRRFEGEYQARKRSAGAYRFDDLPLALVGGGASATDTSRPIEERELDLWFRLDARVDHLLLDEFQDTAPLQWRILEPLADEVLADGTGERTFFCVGDTKQSIYGWRKAEPRLLGNLAQHFAGRIEPEELLVSYRSAPVVMDTVNRVFLAIADNEIFRGDDREVEREAAGAWQRMYGEHRAARTDLAGGACLVMAARPDEEAGESSRDTLIRRTVERVARLAETAPAATVGVLLRKKRDLPKLIHMLRERGVPASGEGGNPLTDAESVLACLSALQLADHPDDTASAFHLATTALGESLGLTPDACRRDGRAARHAWSHDMRARLVREGLGAVVEDFARRFRDAERWSDWDRERGAQLVDLAYAFEGKAGLRPSDFVAHVYQERVESAGGARVRVMTIHASKGLEFDAVVLPEVHESIVGRRAGLLGKRDDPYGDLDTVSLTPTKALAQANVVLGELYDGATRDAVIESLCVLYVALTRAARRIEVVLPWVDREKEDKKKGGLSLDGSALLRCALLDSLDTPVGDDGVVWDHPDGDADWAAGIARAEDAAPAAERPMFRLAPSTRARSAPTRSPSSTEGGGARRGASLVASFRGASVGSVLHRWMEEVEWLDDGVPDDARLRELAAPLTGDEAVVERALAVWRSGLANDAIRAALTRPTDGARREVRNEHAFSVLLPAEGGADAGAGASGADVASGGTGGEELWNGYIDRLVLEYDGDVVVGAEVIDHKSDDVDGADALAEKTAYYRPQLRNYARIVREQFGLDTDRVHARLLFFAAGEVVTV